MHTAEGLVYLHKQGIAHRDLKPANLMVKHVRDSEVLKIADFGTAKSFAQQRVMTTFVGTPQYVAPEVMRGGSNDTSSNTNGYGYEADLWSMGAVMYRMLVGADLVAPTETPVSAYTRLVSQREWDLPPSVRAAVSPACNTFVRALLTVDPQTRARWDRVLSSSWLYPAGRDEIVGPYRFSHQHLLGKGSYARVYRGEDTATGTPVAVKEMDLVELMGKSPSAERAMRALQREIDVMRRLVHPNILRLLADYRAGDKELLVLELCATDMRTVLRDRRPLPEPDALHWMRQLAAGMLYVHAHQILHRDLKPANLLITADRVLKIADFGLARVLEPCQMAATCCGSPLYMAPEVLRATQPYSDRADLWSIGVIFYEILCGALPFTAGNQFELRQKHASRRQWPLPAPIAATVSPACAALVPALLTYDPAERCSWEAFAQCPLWNVTPTQSLPSSTSTLAPAVAPTTTTTTTAAPAASGDDQSSDMDSFEVVEKDTTPEPPASEGLEQQEHQPTASDPPQPQAPGEQEGEAEEDGNNAGDSESTSGRVISPMPVPVKPSAIERAAAELLHWVEMTCTIMEVAETKRGADYLTEALALYSYALDVAKNGLVYASRQLTLEHLSLAHATRAVQTRVHDLRVCADDCARMAAELNVSDSAFCSPPEVLLYEQALYFCKRGASLEMMVAPTKTDALLYYTKAHAIFDALNRFTSDAEDKSCLTTRLFFCFLSCTSLVHVIPLNGCMCWSHSGQADTSESGRSFFRAPELNLKSNECVSVVYDV